MAEIATYACSNTKCALTFRVAHDFPVWKDDAPRELRTPSPSAAAQQYVSRYRSETFCTTCRSVVECSPNMKCSACDTNLTIDHTDRTCTRCIEGTFVMQKLSVF